MHSTTPHTTNIIKHCLWLNCKCREATRGCWLFGLWGGSFLRWDIGLCGGSFLREFLVPRIAGLDLGLQALQKQLSPAAFRTLLLVFCLRWLVVSFTYLARSRLGWHACDIEFSTHEACSWDSRWRIRPNILHGFVKTLNRCRAKMNRSILSHLAFAFILGGTLSFRLLLSGTA